MLRRYLVPSVLLTVIVAVALGLIYPIAMTGIGRAAFPYRTGGSLIKQNGKVIGSALIGQEFLLKNGDADPKYFQPRPSAAGTGYDASASSASNFGPGDARLIGNVSGVNLDGKNQYASKDDPWCVPVQSTDKDDNPITDKAGNPVYDKNKDGSYVCDPNTVPERALAYRDLNKVSSHVKLPVDAVTASGSGLDPDISPANAYLQAPRVAAARHLPRKTVDTLIKQHTNGRNLGFIGEKTVNVLDLNLALDKLQR